MALGPAQRVIIREIQRLHARRAPLNIPAVKRSHPKLIERVYAVRPFWGWKRALEDAGLNYAKINVEVRDYVDCKVCGQDFGALPYHLISQHQITPEEYRHDYPGAELLCETVRAGIVQRKLRKPPRLLHWEAIWTPEYVLDRMAELRRRNLPMNFKWAQHHEKALADKAIRYFGSWDEALRRIDLDPARIRLFRPTWRGKSPWRRANKAVIVAELRRRKKGGEPLSWKKILPTKSGPAFLERAKKLFGSWSAALGAVNIDPSHGANSPWGKANKAAILGEIRRRKRANESLRVNAVWRKKWGQPLVRRASNLFGSWNAALLAAGIEPEGGRSRWAEADKAAILAELRRRKRARESLATRKIESERWGHPLMKRCKTLFGSWRAALLAADVDLPAGLESPWAKADEAAILAELRRRKRERESLLYSKVERERWGAPLLRRSKNLFGSWNTALLAAGSIEIRTLPTKVTRR
jgi:hypothetical protein